MNKKTISKRAEKMRDNIAKSPSPFKSGATIESVEVEFIPAKIWIESDMFGGKHIMAQHKDCDPFEYCFFNYDYRYTSNSSISKAAETVALSLGAIKPIEYKTREFDFDKLIDN